MQLDNQALFCKSNIHSYIFFLNIPKTFLITLQYHTGTQTYSRGTTSQFHWPNAQKTKVLKQVPVEVQYYQSTPTVLIVWVMFYKGGNTSER